MEGRKLDLSGDTALTQLLHSGTWSELFAAGVKYYDQGHLTAAYACLNAGQRKIPHNAHNIMHQALFAREFGRLFEDRGAWADAYAIRVIELKRLNAIGEPATSRRMECLCALLSIMAMDTSKSLAPTTLAAMEVANTRSVFRVQLGATMADAHYFRRHEEDMANKWIRWGLARVPYVKNPMSPHVRDLYAMAAVLEQDVDKADELMNRAMAIPPPYALAVRECRFLFKVALVIGKSASTKVKMNIVLREVDERVRAAVEFNQELAKSAQVLLR